MRSLPNLPAVILAASFIAAPALAQTPPAAPATPSASPATPAAATPNANTVLATVNGQPITMSDIQSAAGDLPSQLQQLPPDQLFSLLVNQQIDRKAVLIAAESAKLQDNPDIAAQMKQAADEKLENAYIQQQVSPQITDAAVQAEYNKEYAGKPGVEQVDARHILVKTEAQAKDIINQLNHGADFAKLAQKDSIDPGAKDGGELGWFTQSEMVPAFANAAFALKPGTYTKTPVQTQFGWHVILSEGKRTEPPPSLADVKDQIHQTLADNAIKATLASARSKVKIVVNNPDGTPSTAQPGAAATGTATPAPAPASGAAPSGQ